MITDLKYLQHMTGNNAALMKDMIELFLNQLADVRENIVKSLHNKDWFELSRMVHRIKSSALVMGVMPMVDVMKELEQLAKEEKNPEKYTGCMTRFHSMIDTVKVELRTFLKTINN